MRLRIALMLLGLASPLAAQGSAGTEQCTIVGFECDKYVVRTGPDSTPRRVAKVIAIWRGQFGFGPHDTAAARAHEAEYRRRSRLAEDLGRTFIGGLSGSGFRELTLSRRAATPGRFWGNLDSAFVAGRAFRIPEGDTALVLLMSGPMRADQPPPTVTSLFTDGLLPPNGEKRWQNGDTTFFIRAPRNAPSLPLGFTEIPAVMAFIKDGR